MCVCVCVRQQSVVSEVVAATAYVELCLRTVTEPDLLRVFLAFLLTTRETSNPNPDPPIITQLISRLHSSNTVSTRLAVLIFLLFIYCFFLLYIFFVFLLLTQLCVFLRLVKCCVVCASYDASEYQSWAFSSPVAPLRR